MPDKQPGMLILSRKVRENIIATLPDGRLITITVCSIDGHKCRIGVIAPADISVNCAEVQAQIELGANGQDLNSMSETERRAAHVRGIQKEIDNDRNPSMP